MGWFDRLLGREPETRSAQLSSWDLLAGRGTDTYSGEHVSPHLAENLSAVFSCIQAIAETVAVLPLYVYRSAGDGVRNSDPAHPVARLFTRAPNDLQTPMEFVETVTAHCALRGNAYCEIVRDGRGAPMELIPLHPDHVGVVRFPGTRRIAFDYSDPNTGGTRRLLQDEVLHLKDRSDDGVVGKSRLQRAREVFGTSLATEKFAGSNFRNGARLSGVLQHPAELGEQASENLRSSFERVHRGAENAGSIAVLEEGVRWQSISVSPEDAELLASRKFGVEQIARIYRCPLPILGVAEGAAYNSVIELHRMFTTHAVMPWVRRWEAAINSSLLSEEARRTHWVEFDLDELTRANLLERWQSYRIARELGAMNANEIRERERLNPRTDEGGNVYLHPLNMGSEQAGAPKDQN